MEVKHENPTNEAETQAQVPANSEQQGETKTFSQEKLDEIVQKRLREQKEKFEKQIDKKVSEGIEDFKRKSQLSEDELRSEEIEKQKQQLEEQTKAFEKEKTDFEMRNMLTESGLNPKLAELVNSNNSETNRQIVDALKQNFEELLKVRLDKELSEVMRGKTPEDTSTQSEVAQPKSGIIAF